MAKYELMVVLESTVADEEVPEAVEKLQKLILDRGATGEQTQRRIAFGYTGRHQKKRREWASDHPRNRLCRF